MGANLLYGLRSALHSIRRRPLFRIWRNMLKQAGDRASGFAETRFLVPGFSQL